jgi:hypothetical protein
MFADNVRTIYDTDRPRNARREREIAEFEIKFCLAEHRNGEG